MSPSLFRCQSTPSYRGLPICQDVRWMTFNHIPTCLVPCMLGICQYVHWITFDHLPTTFWFVGWKTRFVVPSYRCLPLRQDVHWMTFNSLPTCLVPSMLGILLRHLAYRYPHLSRIRMNMLWRHALPFLRYHSSRLAFGSLPHEKGKLYLTTLFVTQTNHFVVNTFVSEHAT